MRQGPDQTEIITEVLVVGGGVSGLTMGLAAAQAGFQTVIVDSSTAEAQKLADSRAFAIAPASMRLFEALGLSQQLGDGAEPVLRMAITDSGRASGAGSNLRLDFTAEDADPESEAPLAFIIENKNLKEALIESAQSAPNLTLLYGRSLVGIEQMSGCAAARFSDGGVIRAQLIIGADGRNSVVRNLCAIDGNGWDYGQTAMTATLAHDIAHDGIAHDIFLKNGPLGVLPLRGRRSSIVWCETPAAAAELMRLSPEDFCAELQTRLGGRLGALTLEGQRAAFALSVFVAEKMIAPRVALIADAAHGMHPLAGQGLNIGLRDIAALAETILDAREIGLDIGAETTLERYQRWRRFDNLSYAAACDALCRLFALQAPPLRALRSFGLAAVNKVAPLRKALAREASGLSNSAPRLLRGESLKSIAS